MEPPVSKKAKMADPSEKMVEDAYVPMATDNGDGATTKISLLFSLGDRKGELVKALQPFQVTSNEDSKRFARCLFPFFPLDIILAVAKLQEIACYDKLKSVGLQVTIALRKTYILGMSTGG